MSFDQGFQNVAYLLISEVVKTKHEIVLDLNVQKFEFTYLINLKICNFFKWKLRTAAIIGFRRFMLSLPDS